MTSKQTWRLFILAAVTACAFVSTTRAEECVFTKPDPAWYRAITEEADSAIVQNEFSIEIEGTRNGYDFTLFDNRCVHVFVSVVISGPAAALGLDNAFEEAATIMKAGLNDISDFDKKLGAQYTQFDRNLVISKTVTDDQTAFTFDFSFN